MPDRAAIVTGASSGIGLAVAHMLGQEGYALTVAARRPEKLQSAVDELEGAGYDVRQVAGNLGDVETIKQVVASENQNKAVESFVKRFQEKWRDKTDCREGFETTSCSNGPEPTPTPDPAQQQAPQQAPAQPPGN